MTKKTLYTAWGKKRKTYSGLPGTGSTRYSSESYYMLRAFYSKQEAETYLATLPAKYEAYLTEA